MFEKRLNEIKERKLEIRGLLEGDSEIKLDELEAELYSLEAELNSLEKRKVIVEGISSGSIEGRQMTPSIILPKKDFNSMTQDELLASEEYRSAFLKTLQRKSLTEIEKRAATTTTAAAAVPTTTQNMIIDKLRQTSVLFNKINVSNVPGNLKLVIANAKNAAAWKSEGNDGTPADDTVTYVSLAGFELIKLAEISAAAEAMTISAFEAYITSEIGRQMSIAIENAILTGAGTTEPTGILTGVTFDVTNTVNWTTSVDYDTIVDMLALLPTMYHQNSYFILNRSMLFSGIRKIKAADGQPIFAYNAQDRAAMTLLGYPVVLDDYMPANTILLGDTNYYYMNFAKPIEIASDRSVGFKSGKITYRGLAVIDGKPTLNEAFVKGVLA